MVLEFLVVASFSVGKYSEVSLSDIIFKRMDLSPPSPPHLFRSLVNHISGAQDRLQLGMNYWINHSSITEVLITD